MLSEIIYNLCKQLYPTGRAFRIADGSAKEKFHRGLAVSEEQANRDASSILNAILPDNLDFTVDDATDWERRLGMIYSPLTALEDRKLAIRRKLQAPGTQPAHGHYLYLQRQLRAAGFDVYVYENRFPVYPSGYETQSPLDVSGDPSILAEVQHGDFQHGQISHGIHYTNIIANSLDAEVDAIFNLGGTFVSSFFIGGNPLGTFASVPAVREKEFRELILKIKQVQSIGFLFINYI